MTDELDPLPDLATVGDDDLRSLIDQYVEEEQRVSYRRRILHGYIDILRTELISRKKEAYDKGSLGELSVDRLTDILSGKSAADLEEA